MIKKSKSSYHLTKSTNVNSIHLNIFLVATKDRNFPPQKSVQIVVNAPLLIIIPNSNTCNNSFEDIYSSILIVDDSDNQNLKEDHSVCFITFIKLGVF